MYAILSLLFAAVWFLMGMTFLGLKERGADLISGFSTKPLEERMKYDRARMSRDMRNDFFLWMLVFLIGAAVSYFWTLGFWIATAIWIVLVFRNVHLDEEKAFGKYKLDK